MSRKISNTTRAVLILEFIIALYMIISLTTSKYNSYKTLEYIEKYKLENEKLAEENSKLEEQYEYYQSAEYQEKIAKQNFGLINPGEKVLIIPEKSVQTPEEEFNDTVINEKIIFYQGLSNPIKWWYYFFG